MLGNGIDAPKMVGFENQNAVHEDGNVATHHFQSNPTELNQNLGTGDNASGISPQLQKPEGDETKKRKRKSKGESSEETRTEQQEANRARKSVGYLRARNAEFKKKLLCLSEECENLNSENNSILEELVEKYGQEQVDNFINLKPT